jgi:hypothetical protein
MNEKLEQALALGFPSIEACEEHQRWLDRQRVIGERVKKAVSESRKTGMVDLRNLMDR